MATDGKLEKYKEDLFPLLRTTEYHITSKPSRQYNCFAWAAQEDDRWWNPLEPDKPDNPYY